MSAVEWLRSCRREWLGADVLAGLTAGAAVVPLGQRRRGRVRAASAGPLTGNG